MKLCRSILVIGIFLGVQVGIARFLDKPCAARAIANRSVVCVCTAEYCDTVIRETPSSGVFYTYTSSECGLRFKKRSKKLQIHHKDLRRPHRFTGPLHPDVTLILDPTKKYQSIHGFGGAVTDSAGINWKNLSNSLLMHNFIESYCGTAGIEYSMLRVPMGSTDFGSRTYAYNELPENDIYLSNFSLAYEDYEYKIPMIQACMKASNTSIKFLASLWSPPPWMKTNNAFTGHSRLKKEYFATFVYYFFMFLEKYKEETIDFWGITITNQPMSGTVNVFNGISNLGWTLDYLAEWLLFYFGPTIRKSCYKDIKILVCDDQRYTIPLWLTLFIKAYPATNQYIDGVAVHYYYDDLVPPSLMTLTMAEHPDKFLLYTEACTGRSPELSVDLGSWLRAETYILNILEDLNYNATGWLDWNMALNEQGGPSVRRRYVDSPVIVNAEAGEFLKQPMFYAIGHFSKFLPPESRRIEVTASSAEVQNVAFLTPHNTIVVVMYNSGKERSVIIELGSSQARVKMVAASITTVELSYSGQ